MILEFSYLEHLMTQKRILTSGIGTKEYHIKYDYQ